MTEFTYRDQDGDEIRVSPGENSGEAFVSAVNQQGERRSVIIPAHALREVVGAMYEAAGQPVPDLPVIHDEADVKSLAGLIHFACEGARSHSTSNDQRIARVLLAHGVTLPAGRSDG